MPGTGTKQKKAAAPPPAVAASAPTVITVTGGVPAPNEVTVPSGTRIIFINNDQASYTIEMTANNATAPIEVLLPGLTTVTVVANSPNGKKTVDYLLNVLPQARSSSAVTNDAGGGGRIIISS
jgi:plastocyanin